MIVLYLAGSAIGTGGVKRQVEHVQWISKRGLRAGVDPGQYHLRGLHLLQSSFGVLETIDARLAECETAVGAQHRVTNGEEDDRVTCSQGMSKKGRRECISILPPVVAAYGGF